MLNCVLYLQFTRLYNRYILKSFLDSLFMFFHNFLTNINILFIFQEYTFNLFLFSFKRNREFFLLKYFLTFSCSLSVWCFCVTYHTESLIRLTEESTRLIVLRDYRIVVIKKKPRVVTTSKDSLYKFLP